MKLTGKVALITNVSEFMGPAITEEFAREGATLALHDRDEAAAKRIGAIATAVGRETLVLTGDLTESAEADRVVGETVARFGHLDILVNNSANLPTGSPTERITDAQWHDAFRAANYADPDAERFIRRLKQKIDDGLALRARPIDLATR